MESATEQEAIKSSTDIIRDNENFLIVESKYWISKCETCKYLFTDPAIIWAKRCSKTGNTIPLKDFFCGYHEPKPEKTV